MTFIVRCCNYEGANFRGIQSDTDETLCILPIKGDEHKICTFLLNNCSYGQAAENKHITSIAELCVLLNHDHIPVFDGCGAILSIEHNGKVLVDIRDQYDGDGSLSDSANWITLPEVDVDTMSDNKLNSINVLNQMVVDVFVDKSKSVITSSTSPSEQDIKDVMMELVLGLESSTNSCKLLLTDLSGFDSSKFARNLSEMDDLRTALNQMYCKIM